MDYGTGLIGNGIKDNKLQPKTFLEAELTTAVFISEFISC
jgi:hypothetical protein